MKLSILSNINVDSLINKISMEYEVYQTEGYGVWLQEITNPNSGLYAFRPETVFIIVDGEEIFKGLGVETGLEKTIKYIKEAADSNPEITFFISDIDIWQEEIRSAKSPSVGEEYERLWGEGLHRLSEQCKNVYIFGLKAIIQIIGREQFYSRKLWYLGGIKFTMKAERLLEQQIKRYINSLRGIKKKCLILDLDNTLWGGIVGEDGLEGIELSDYKEGARYKDFPKRLKEIKGLGVILAVVSKNNYEDAIKVFREHDHMVLAENDFVGLKINWDLKSNNIRALSEELNIGLDSFVFIDDNPVERESVKRELPQVAVPDFPEDTSMLSDFALEVYNSYFYTLDVTDEDIAKTKIYRENVKRKNAQRTSASYEEFLKSLDTKIKIKKIEPGDIRRVTQLVQKTNQFNLTTKRYSEQELLEMIGQNNIMGFAAYVSDKFGDNGLVCVAILRCKSDDVAELDTFLLSCRVMGRFIEDQIISYIESFCKGKGYKKLIGHYIPTKRNAPAKGLFDRLGYSLTDGGSESGEEYALDLGKSDSPPRKKFGEMVII
ncbi:MAG: HAD-IIIC family phosphatase [Clostridium sp.]|nr:HAD-IIIC family phosphatase [Clostridium sp.]